MRVAEVSAHVTVSLWLCACSSGPPAESPRTTGDPHAPSEPGHAPTAMAVESELGSLDKAEVQATFRKAMTDVDRCVAVGRERIPFLGGAIEVVVRIAEDGSARFAYLLRSDLGDHETESCILEALRNQTWPRPAGGKEGETVQQLDLGEPDERPPVPWSTADLGPRFRGVGASLAGCRRRAQAGPLEVTFYVDPDGRPMAAGVAVADENGLEAIDCAVRAIRAARFASPGSYPAKVSVRVD